MERQLLKKRVWLDTDPGIGVTLRDIDDGLAILFLLGSPEVSLEGISINFGNVKADRGFEVAREVLEVAEADVPFYKGANSRKEFGEKNPAVQALIEAVADNPGEISLLTIGPLTNVGTAMTLDPDFSKNLRELVIMGGALKFWPFSTFGEFNFHMDGRATKIVTGAPVEKTVINMDVCSQAIFGTEHLDRIRQHDSKVARYLARTIPSWLNINRVLFRKGGFYPWDPVAAAYLTDESLFDSNPCTFEVEPGGWRSGKILDLKMREDFEPKDGVVPINMPRKIDSERFMDLLLERLLGI